MNTLPIPERILHQHIAVLGKTGSGKSSALRLIVEHLLDRKKRTAIIDPKGDWWGLKSSADGKGPGFPVIMFGDFKEPRASDVPVNDRSGKHVAELIATGNRPAVLGFRGWMPGQLTRFWLEFAPTLFNQNEGELFVVIDEVHNFAPKGKILDPDSGKCLHWTNRIMSEGRGLGLTFLIASQRPQKVHNDTLDNCETLVAMRMAHPRSRESVKEWIDGNGDPSTGKEVLATLAQMQRGEAWVWSPEEKFGPVRVTFPMFRTFDSFAPPQLQKKVHQAGWSEIDLEQVKEKLSAVIAEAKANDPKELKAEIGRLRTEIAKGSSTKVPAPGPVVDSRAIQRAIAESLKPYENFRKITALQIAKACRAIEQVSGEALSSLRQISDAAGNLPDPKLTAPAVALPVDRSPAARVPSPSNALVAPSLRAKPAPGHSNGDDTPLTKAQRSILSVLVNHGASPKQKLAILAGYSSNGGGFNNALGNLRTRGFVTTGDPIEITIVGRASLGDVDPLPTGRAFFEMWLNHSSLLRSSKAILRVLEREWTNSRTLTKDELAELAGYSSNGGGFNNGLGRLRALGLVNGLELSDEMKAASNG